MERNIVKYKTIKMTITYDGSRYLGWQRLQGKQEGAAIQDIIEKILSAILTRECKIHGAGRTDAGVHAYEQVAHFYLEEDWISQLKDIKGQLNTRLPEDIRIVDLIQVQGKFQSRYDAKAKVYTYCIETGDRPRVFERKYVLWIPESLNIDAMRKGAKYLEGTHDFKGFSSKMKDGRKTHKTIYETKIEVKGSKIQFSVMADGFLYHMMRIITGTIIEIGMGKRDPESIIEIFKHQEREKAGYKVSGHGLFLKKIFYTDEIKMKKNIDS